MSRINNILEAVRDIRAILGLVLLLLTGGFLQPSVAQMQVSNQVVGTQESFSNAVSILVGPDVIIESTGEVSLNSPLVAFAGLVKIAGGGSMVVTNMAFSGVDVEDELSIIPATFEVDQNFPNPFRTTTRITYVLKENGHAEVAVFNMIGQRVGTLRSGSQLAGKHEVTWNGQLDSGERAPSGVYIYKVTSGEQSISRQMILLR